MTAVFDLHDQAYDVWRDAGARHEVLVHVDAHHDAAQDPPWTAIDIGNYVRAAIRENMVSAVRWVVPDPMWSDAATRTILGSELRHIADRRSVSSRSGSDGMRAMVGGVEMWMGPLATIPACPSRVLLDIDVDFLLTTRYEHDRTAEPLAVPWCWPDEVVSRLRARGLTSSLTTVATSVTGGFAPLRWAHLGREIAARVDGPASCAMLSCFASLRNAAIFAEGGDAPRALEACRAAVAMCPEEAAAHFHLAEALQAGERLDEAREAYRCARSLDPSYGHAFRTRGPYLYRRKRMREAENAYLAALALDPDDGHAQLGLAMVAIRLGRVQEAHDLAAASLTRQPDAVDAWRTLGEARARLGDRRAAIQAYERALALSLRGAVPLRGPWSSNPNRRLVDPRHWSDHAAAGDLHAALGDIDAALAHYRIAAAGAPQARRLRRRLAILRARGRLGRAFGDMLPS
jgi:tetratricopeptide (TPR) repeat protein